MDGRSRSGPRKYFAQYVCGCQVGPVWNRDLPHTCPDHARALAAKWRAVPVQQRNDAKHSHAVHVKADVYGMVKELAAASGVSVPALLSKFITKLYKNYITEKEIRAARTQP